MDNTDNLIRELAAIEHKLINMRQWWVEASPAKKKYIESAAKLYTEKRDKLKRRLDA